MLTIALPNYEWEDNNGIRHVTAWSKAVRNAMLRGGAEYQVQRVLERAGTNWNKHFLQSTDAGRQDLRQSACAGVQSDLMDAESWGRRCMLQLQVTENWNKAAATTWSADFLRMHDDYHPNVSSGQRALKG